MIRSPVQTRSFTGKEKKNMSTSGNASSKLPQGSTPAFGVEDAGITSEMESYAERKPSFSSEYRHQEEDPRVHPRFSSSGDDAFAGRISPEPQVPGEFAGRRYEGYASVPNPM